MNDRTIPLARTHHSVEQETIAIIVGHNKVVIPITDCERLIQRIQAAQRAQYAANESQRTTTH